MFVVAIDHDAYKKIHIYADNKKVSLRLIQSSYLKKRNGPIFFIYLIYPVIRALKMNSFRISMKLPIV